MFDYQTQPDNDSGSAITYKGLLVLNTDKSKRHCLLVLSGTSTQISDIGFFIDRLIERGYSVASIERVIGGPFHVWMKPKVERKEALKHFLRQLIETHHIEKIDIIAHSYAPFEVVRLLLTAPERYRRNIDNLLFVNPAGFNDHIQYIPHCLRFSFIFIMKEWGRAVLNRVRPSISDRLFKEFYFNKLHAITCLFLKTVINPVRTFREVADIVSFKLTGHVKQLIDRYGYKVYFFINTGDELVMASKTLDHVKQFVPENRIRTFPGNHLDMLIHREQTNTFLDYLDNVKVMS